MGRSTCIGCGGLEAFEKFIDAVRKDTHILVCDIPFQPLKTLARAKVAPIEGVLSFYNSMDHALEAVKAIEQAGSIDTEKPITTP